MSNTKTIIVDARELEAPHPLLEVSKALVSVDEETNIKFIHRMHPCRLFDILDQKGLSYEEIQNSEGVIVYIWHPKGKKPECEA